MTAIGLIVSDAPWPLVFPIDDEAACGSTQCHGISSSIRACGQPLTMRVTRACNVTGSHGYPVGCGVMMKVDHSEADTAGETGRGARARDRVQD
jgi:hypothetical protein